MGVKRIVTGAIIVIAAGVILAVTCPDEANFKRWAKEKITPESGSVVKQAKGTALATQAKWTADYENHILWATVEAYQGGARQRFVGVMGTWFRLSSE